MILDGTPARLRREVDIIAEFLGMTEDEREALYQRALEAYRNVRDRRVPRYVEVQGMR